MVVPWVKKWRKYGSRRRICSPAGSSPTDSQALRQMGSLRRRRRAVRAGLLSGIRRRCRTERRMSQLPETRPPCTADVVALPVAPRARGGLGVQRSTRRLTLRPKYGSGPRAVDVRYLWCGVPDAPTVIVQGGISADRDVTAPADAAPGWWQALVAEEAAIDLTRYRVLAIDWLTPAELGAGTISSEDQADALAALLDALDIA